MGYDHQQAATLILAEATECAICHLPPAPGDPLTAGHIDDRQIGGGNELANYQPEHLSCNSRKKALGSRIVLVAGPPCAGKTTYVQHQAIDGDLVLDLDAIARDLGSTRYWHHDAATMARANAVMRREVLRLAATRRGRAWIIRCVPNGRTRTGLARMVRADEVVVLLPPGRTLVRRAQARPDPVGTIRSINDWLARYTESPLDTVIKDARRIRARSQA
ncbi:AAA family ATPase [Planobispora longispora]|uniref:AAA family ATPase n=1 Tax=Planobispora longispora TaxID=28887 RepID=UPI001944DECE|nr:AAA family ATPase [Planobispora longispora]